jgi:TM2 domain-containing membrane protein YozV
MIGKIESYDPETQSGAIKSEEKFYAFHIDDWVAQVPPEAGDDVKFDGEGTAATNIDLIGAYLGAPTAVKRKYVAAFLGLLFGWLGLHRLYLGYYRVALMQLALTFVLGVAGLFGFAAVWGFIEAFLIFGGHLNKDAKGRPLK